MRNFISLHLVIIYIFHSSAIIAVKVIAVDLISSVPAVLKFNEISFIRFLETNIAFYVLFVAQLFLINFVWAAEKQSKKEERKRNNMVLEFWINNCVVFEKLFKSFLINIAIDDRFNGHVY